MYASVTSLLIFHRFLDQNDNYRALVKTAVPEEPSHQLISNIGGDAAEDASDPEAIEDLGLSFGPLTESEVMGGYIVKERLLRLLDHPALTNHLLRDKNILPLIVGPAVCPMFKLTSHRGGSLPWSCAIAGRCEDM
jgi:hypothetical protein